MRVLFVNFPFAGFAKGEIIADKDEVERYLASHRSHVVPANLPDDHPSVMAALEKETAPAPVKAPVDDAGETAH